MRLLMSKSKPISLVSTNLFRNYRITCLNETGCDVCVGWDESHPHTPPARHGKMYFFGLDGEQQETLG